MPREIPRVFAIVRNAYEPCLQILEAHPSSYRNRINTNGNIRDCYDIQSHTGSFDLEGLYVHEQTWEHLDRRIYVVNYQDHHTREIQEVKYWYTPFYIPGRLAPNIPILEFQYRSWIPSRYQPFPINTDLERMTRTLQGIQQERLHEIQIQEDSETPRRRHPSSNTRRYEHDYEPQIYPDLNEYIGSRIQTPPRIVERVRVVEVQVPVSVERVVVEQRALPLPKRVGDILLLNARKGSESCPIAITPFSDCESLCVLSCFHIFDKASLVRWQQTNRTCPVCRCKIENVVSE